MKKTGRFVNLELDKVCSTINLTGKICRVCGSDKLKYEPPRKGVMIMNEKIFENIKKEYDIFAKAAGKIKKDDKRNILLGALLGILAAKKTYNFELNEDFVIKGIERIEEML
jgi:hypothetical protein